MHIITFPYNSPFLLEFIGPPKGYKTQQWKVTYDFGVKLVGSAGQHLVNGRRVFVDDKSKPSENADEYCKQHVL